MVTPRKSATRFAPSTRGLESFHLPIVPFTLMFAAYGISKMNEVWWVKKYYPYWCALMFVAAIAWNWFKLAGRGMI